MVSRVMSYCSLGPHLQDRTQCCSVNGHTSTLQKITCGVLQGSILGPLHFIIYTNDLPSYVKDVSVTMYADDTSLDKAFHSSQQLKEEMIPAFSGVCKWLQTNKLSLNTVKIELMIIGISQRLNQLDQNPKSTPYAINIEGQNMRRIKLVGWNYHIEHISNKMSCDIGS